MCVRGKVAERSAVGAACAAQGVWVERVAENKAGKAQQPVLFLLSSPSTVPDVLEMLPQVQEVLANVGKAANLTVLTVYGGTPYEGQETMLRRVRGRGGRGPGRLKEGRDQAGFQSLGRAGRGRGLQSSGRAGRAQAGR